MSAYRAYFWGLRANYYMTAVAAFPYRNGALFKYACGFDVFKQGAIAFLVVFFDCAYKTEFFRKFVKPSSSAVFAKPSYISVHS